MDARGRVGGRGGRRGGQRSTSGDKIIKSWDVRYGMVTIVNNTIMRVWKWLRAGLESPCHKQKKRVALWGTDVN